MLGHNANRGPDSAGDLTPSSSAPGTPALGHSGGGLPGISGLPLSGRASRLSDVGSDRLSLGTGTGTTLVPSTHSTSGTDHAMDRYF